MQYINLTEHSVKVVNGDNVQVFEPSGQVARISTNPVKVGEDTEKGIPFFKTSYGETTNLPPAKNETYYIVSALVRIGNESRKDLLSPSSLLRDSKGVVIGCKGFDIN
jgi:hypothetical protein